MDESAAESFAGSGLAIRGEKDRERRLEPCKKCDKKCRNYWELAIHSRQEHKTEIPKPEKKIYPSIKYGKYVYHYHKAFGLKWPKIDVALIMRAVHLTQNKGSLPVERRPRDSQDDFEQKDSGQRLGVAGRDFGISVSGSPLRPDLHEHFGLLHPCRNSQSSRLAKTRTTLLSLRPVWQKLWQF